MLFVYFLVCFFAFCTQKAKICSIVRLKIQPGQKRTANLQISWATQEAAKRCTDERHPVRSDDSLISILLSLWWFSKWFNLFQRGVAVTEQTLSLQQSASMNCAFDLKLRWEEWKRLFFFFNHFYAFLWTLRASRMYSSGEIFLKWVILAKVTAFQAQWWLWTKWNAGL